MEKTLTFLLAVFLLMGTGPKLLAQSYTPLVITIDENNPSQSATEIIDSIQRAGLYLYPGADRDLINIINAKMATHALCPSLSFCPPEPDPIIDDLPNGNYLLTLTGLSGLIGDTDINNIYSSYLRYNTPATPGQPNFSLMESNLNQISIEMPVGLVANTILLMASLHPNGRSSIQAIIIADKYILRSN